MGKKRKKVEVRIKNVSCRGEAGEFRANEEMIGWKGANESVVHEAVHMKRAEWLAGKLRVELSDGVDSSILPLDGFEEEDFDKLQRFFATFSIDIKKSDTKDSVLVPVERQLSPSPTAAVGFDTEMKKFEKSADLVDEAKNAVLKNVRETDFLKNAERLRDTLDLALKGERIDLERVYGENECERIVRLRLVIETVKLEIHLGDPRWVQLRDIAAAIEAVLRDLGSFSRWTPPESDTSSSIAKRQMMLEVQRKESKTLGDKPFMEGLLQAESQEISGIQLDTDIVVSDAAMCPNELDTDASNEQLEAKSRSGSVEQVEGADAQQTTSSQSQGGSRQLPLLPALSLDKLNGESIIEEEPTEGEDVTGDPNARTATPRNQVNPATLCNAEERRMHYMRTDSVLEGWVWKQSRHLKWWRRRWLILTKLGLETMKTHGSFQPTESIERSSYGGVFCAQGQSKKERSFCVVDRAGKRFFLACDTEDEKVDWIREIDSVLSRRQGTSTPARPLLPRFS